MKCSEYLWRYIDLMKRMPNAPTHQVQGELYQAMLTNGDTRIVSDTSGKSMKDWEALSVYGRNEDRLREAYKMGSKSLFELVCKAQITSDDEWKAAKEQAEAEVSSAE